LSITINCENRFDQRPVAVLFDLDNTVYRYGQPHEAAIEAVKDKAEQTLSVSPAEFEHALSKARGEIKERLGTTASSHSRLLYFQCALEILGLRSQVLLSLEFEQTYWRTFLSRVELRPGIIEFLDQLNRSNVPKVVVTDLTAQVQFRKLLYFGLDRLFEYVVTSEETGSDKPASISYSLALSKLGNPDGAVWMVGDDYDSDIVGARRAIGAVTLAVRSELTDPADVSEPPDMVFDDFKDLEKFWGARGWELSSAPAN